MCYCILLKDEYSNFGTKDKDRQPYGRKGEKVKVISDRGGVLIVETAANVRFPVNQKDVTRL